MLKIFYFAVAHMAPSLAPYNEDHNRTQPHKWGPVTTPDALSELGTRNENGPMTNLAGRQLKRLKFTPKATVKTEIKK